MTYTVFLLVQGTLFGLVVVASNPSPYFGALGLVVVSGMGCGLMVMWGGTFLSLILFLIYLGGMLVVFAYSSALASESYPESWASPRIVLSCFIYVIVVVGGNLLFSREWSKETGGTSDVHWGESLVRGDQAGVSVMYSLGGWALVAAAWVLLLTLFVVLEVVRGGSRGAVRAV